MVVFWENVQGRTEVNPVPNNGTAATPSAPGPQHPQQVQQQPRTARYCTNCHNNAHTAETCTSTWTREGKWIGSGTPPSNNHWTHKTVKDTKKAAMVNTPPPPRQLPQPRQQQPPRQYYEPRQQQQPQPRQQQKPCQQQQPRKQQPSAAPPRKKVTFKA